MNSLIRACVLAACGAFVTIAGAADDPAAAWARFTTPDGGLSVLMPGEPGRADDTVKTPIGKRDVVRYQIQDAHALFDAGYLERDRSGLGALASDSRLLDSACKGTAKHMGGRIAASTAVRVDGLMARDLDIAFDDESLPHAHARVVLTKTRVYHTIITPSDAAGEACAAEFVGSMHVREVGAAG